MSTPMAVAWLEGVELYPQHLQQQDAHQEALLSARVSQLAPQAWGVSALELDRAALAAGQVRIARFEGVMPDGLYVAFGPGGGEAPSARTLEGHFGPTQKSLDVHLAVPRARPGSPLYAEAGGPGAGHARFLVVGQPVVDAGGTAGEQTVSVLRPNAAVLLGGEIRGDHVTLKIAEIVRDGRGAVVLNDRFVPPALRVGASPFIGLELGRLLALFVAKQGELSRARRQGQGSSVDFGAGDVTRYLQLSAVSGAIPVIKHLAETPELSPMTAYLALAQIFGALCTFTIDADPSEAPRYDPLAPGPVFEELFARITALLHATVRDQFVSIPLQLQDGRLVVGLEHPQLEHARDIVLAVRSELPEGELVERFGRMAKIASARDVAYLVRANSSGAVLRPLTKAPPEIPVRAGVCYFGISPQDSHWQGALRDRSLAVALPPGMSAATTSVELIVVPSAGR